MKRVLILVLLILAPALGRSLEDDTSVRRGDWTLSAGHFVPVQPGHTAQSTGAVVALVPLDAGAPPIPRAPRPPSARDVNAFAVPGIRAATLARQRLRLDYVQALDFARSGRLPAFASTPPPSVHG